jgi:hypothetical protein
MSISTSLNTSAQGPGRGDGGKSRMRNIKYRGTLKMYFFIRWLREPQSADVATRQVKSKRAETKNLNLNLTFEF